MDSLRDLSLVDLGLTAEHLRVLGRLVAVGGIICALALGALAMRVEADRATQEIRLYERQMRAAVATRQQLQLDLAARVAHVQLETAATTYGLLPAGRIEVVRAEPIP